jgi:hypothetical protein
VQKHRDNSGLVSFGEEMQGNAELSHERLQATQRVFERTDALLWYGLTDKAKALLEGIEATSVKNQEQLEKLIAYLERNKPYIPCYEIRKELGLRNSSAIGEKMNDLLVSDRQKHNGMSWSENGSVALAAITALKRNKEHKRWFEKEEIEFKLAA